MRIVFLSHYFSPHIGGVERHVLFLSHELIRQGHSVTVITERFDHKLKSREVVDGIKVIRFDYPKKRFVGLLYIWHFLWEKRDLLLGNDIVHIHDVFIWYLPLRFLFFWKKIYITIHGLEWGNPFSLSGLLQKRLSVKLSGGAIGVGKFLEKYIGVKFTKVIYGAVNARDSSASLRMTRKIKNTIVFVGRLSEDTGVLQFLEYLKSHKKLRASFVGDGELRDKCEQFGKVYGFIKPEKFLRKAEYAAPGGYLACLEAFSYKCGVKVFWNSKLKEDYWQMSPMYKFIKNGDVDGAFEWVKERNWKNLVNEYVKVWN
jgi:glycosyltransferase involved in cell wall biosynthesis